MKNILNKADADEMLLRISKLHPESKALWGKMNVNEMLCHCADQLRMAFGEIKTKAFGGIIHRTLLKFLVLYVIKAPKGKVKTAAEIDQSKKAGTASTDFESDRKLLSEIINRFCDDKTIELFPHPAFGKLSRNEWGRMIWLHLDHHLEQFGV